MSAWVVPLVASLVALIVGIGVEQFQWTGRTRRRLTTDLQLYEKLVDGDAKTELMNHVEVRTRLLVAAEAPLRDSERRRQRRGRWLLFYGSIVYMAGWMLFWGGFLPPESVDRIWAGPVNSRWFWHMVTFLGLGALVIGAVEVLFAREQRRRRAEVRYRRAMGAPDEAKPIPLVISMTLENRRRRRSS